MRRGGVDSPAWIERGLSAILTPELPIQTFLVGVMTAAAGSRRVTTLAWSEPKIEPTIPYLTRHSRNQTGRTFKKLGYFKNTLNALMEAAFQRSRKISLPEKQQIYS
jgi:hypothetical protein